MQTSSRSKYDCFSCGKQYEDGQEDLWIGYDTCYWWYYFKCAGFSRYLTRKMNSSVAPAV